jgi:hypothetical protein
MLLFVKGMTVNISREEGFSGAGLEGFPGWVRE